MTTSTGLKSPRLQALDSEIELLTSSLLPTETLTSSPRDQWPRFVVIASTESQLAVHVRVDGQYPHQSAVKIDVKGASDGREEAEGWKEWVKERMEEWDGDTEYPLYQIMSTHFLPLFAPSSPSPQPETTSPTNPQPSVPHHVLLTSHHLLAPSKRKDLQTLSSQLSLVGFAKTGHPGIIYAIGGRDDLVEWLREVKSWQWLALKVRFAPEPLPDATAQEVEGGRGSEQGARGGKGRGEWIEVEKIGEAIEWLRKRGRERLLTDLGMGSGPG